MDTGRHLTVLPSGGREDAIQNTTPSIETWWQHTGHVVRSPSPVSVFLAIY